MTCCAPKGNVQRNARESRISFIRYLYRIRLISGGCHLFYGCKNTRNDNRAKKKMFRNQQKSYIYKDRQYKSRKRIIRNQSSSVNCLIYFALTVICIFVFTILLFYQLFYNIFATATNKNNK